MSKVSMLSPLSFTKLRFRQVLPFCQATFGHFMNYSLCMIFHSFFFVFFEHSYPKRSYNEKWMSLYSPIHCICDQTCKNLGKTPTQHMQQKDWAVWGRGWMYRAVSYATSPLTSLCVFLRIRAQRISARSCAGASCQSAVFPWTRL